MRIKTLFAAAALPLAWLPAAAFAQDEAEETAGPITIDFEVAGLSDYRFRGVSLSGKDPEVTGEVSISHESGLYSAVWVSNVDSDFDGKGKEVEVDLTAGFSKDIGPINFDGGAIYYTYPNEHGASYIELFGGVTVPAGPASITVGAAYAPSQGALGHTDNTYVYISGELPVKDTPISLHGTFGYEDGAFADKKKDWLVGASYDIGSGFTATLDYVDTKHSLTSLGDATAVFSIAKSF